MDKTQIKYLYDKIQNHLDDLKHNVCIFDEQSPAEHRKIIDGEITHSIAEILRLSTQILNYK